MVPFVSYVSLGQSKPRLTFSHINGPYVLNFASVTSTAEQLKFLVWKWHQMNLIVLKKPSIIKSWLCFSIRNIRSLLHVVKTDKKSRSLESKLVSNYMWHWYAINFCKFLAFSIVLRTQTVYLNVSFIIYSALSMPPFFLLYVVTFERLAKTFQFLKIIHSSYSRSYFSLFNLCRWVQCT